MRITLAQRMPHFPPVSTPVNMSAPQVPVNTLWWQGSLAAARVLQFARRDLISYKATQVLARNPSFACLDRGEASRIEREVAYRFRSKPLRQGQENSSSGQHRLAKPAAHRRPCTAVSLARPDRAVDHLCNRVPSRQSTSGQRTSALARVAPARLWPRDAAGSTPVGGRSSPSLRSKL